MQCTDCGCILTNYNYCECRICQDPLCKECYDIQDGMCEYCENEYYEDDDLW